MNENISCVYAGCCVIISLRTRKNKPIAKGGNSMHKAKSIIQLDIDTFLSFQKMKGWNESETAANLNVSPEQLWKIKKGKHNPGQDFIAGVLTAFPEASFDDFFIVPNSLRLRKRIM